MSGHCGVCGETICVCDEKIETINEEKRMSIEAMKLALKALQNTRTHPLTDAEQYEIQKGMLKIKESSEDFFRAEYWERWVLHTYPNVDKAKLYMTMSQGILFMPTPEDLWFTNCR